MARTRRKAQYRCVLCGGPYSEDQMYGVKGAVASDEALDLGARLVDVDFAGLAISAIVVNPGAPMLAQGFQLLFPVCSNACQRALAILSLLDAVVYSRDVPDQTGEGIFGLRLWREEREIVLSESSLSDIRFLVNKLPAVIRERFGWSDDDLEFPEDADPPEVAH